MRQRKERIAQKWKSIKPHSQVSRTNMLRKYGHSCFLDPKRKKYPVCNKYNGKKECVGHYAAQYYLNINAGKLKNKRNKVATKKRKKYLNLLKKSTSYTKKHCTAREKNWRRFSRQDKKTKVFHITMPTYKITVPSPTKTICIRVNQCKDESYVTSFDPSLAGQVVLFDTTGLLPKDSIYFTNTKKQVIWRSWTRRRFYRVNKNI